MKKKLLVLFAIMAIVVISSLALSAFSKRKNDNNKTTIVTSFYPMYVIALNIAGNIPGIEVVNLTEPTSGCLHDYQLTTSDMMKLEGADVLVMNGGGMENFIENVLETYPELPVINASEGIEFLKSTGHNHEHENEAAELNELTEDKHVDQENNAHVWLNMNYYLQQIQTVQDALAKQDPQNAEAYQKNGDAYQSKILSLKEEMETALAGSKKAKIVIFHDSFAYLAQEFGLEVVHTVNMDSESALSAGEIAEVVDEVKEEQIKILFTEEQFSTSIADSVAKESGAAVYVMDSIVRGDMSEDGYINAMKRNMETLKKALITE